jgi:hypothetical protein
VVKITGSAPRAAEETLSVMLPSDAEARVEPEDKVYESGCDGGVVEQRVNHERLGGGINLVRPDQFKNC